MELSKAPPPPCSHRYGRKEGDMEAMLMSSPFSSKSLNPIATINPNKTLRPIRLDLQLPINSKPSKPPSSTPIFAVNPATATNGRREDNPLVVVGSANADIYVEIERLPREGGTVSAKTGETLAGGKGANQAACGAKLEHPTFFIGQLGSDAHGGLIAGALADGGVRLDRVRSNEGAPTGHAVVMLQEDGQNSIIIVGGANMNCWPEEIGGEDLELIRTAGVVLLQREIPDRVNVQVAKAAKAANVPVILDAGGMDGPFPAELLKNIDILSPNESELARLTGFPTDSFEQISQAVSKCHEMGVKQVLVKLGAKGSALFIEGKEPIRQPIVPAEKVLDTTGAGDTFTAAFAVALVEGKPLKDCMQFAAAAASLCVQVKGAIPSIPDRKAVLNLVQSLQ